MTPSADVRASARADRWPDRALNEAGRRAWLQVVLYPYAPTATQSSDMPFKRSRLAAAILGCACSLSIGIGAAADAPAGAAELEAMSARFAPVDVRVDLRRLPDERARRACAPDRGLAHRRRAVHAAALGRQRSPAAASC